MGRVRHWGIIMMMIMTTKIIEIVKVTATLIINISIFIDNRKQQQNDSLFLIHPPGGICDHIDLPTLILLHFACRCFFL